MSSIQLYLLLMIQLNYASAYSRTKADENTMLSSSLDQYENDIEWCRECYMYIILSHFGT